MSASTGAAPVCALAGYFGFGNAGDEMIAELLRRRIPDVRWLLLTNTPSASDPNAADRWNPFAVARALWRSRALVFGGGEIFQARTSFLSLLYYLALIAAARLLGRRVFFYGIGVDPALSGPGAALVSAAGRAAAAVWSRDPDTGRRFPLSSAVPDPVWAWPAPRRASSAAPRGSVLWVLRLADSELDLSEWTAALNAFSVDGPQGFLPMHPALDLPMLARFRLRLAFAHTLETWREPDDLFAVLSRYETVVTMRFHGIILAALAGRRVAAVARHGKVEQLARSLEVPVVARAALGPESIRDAVARARLVPEGDVDRFRGPAAAGLDELSRALAPGR